MWSQTNVVCRHLKVLDVTRKVVFRNFEDTAQNIPPCAVGTGFIDRLLSTGAVVCFVHTWYVFT